MMKRMLAWTLALVLCLTLGVASAEDYAVEMATEEGVYQFGRLCIGLKVGDVVQYMTEEVDQQVLLQMFPAYDEAASFHNNLNAVWISQAVNMVEELGSMTADEWATAQIQATMAGLEAMGVAISNPQILFCEIGEPGEYQQGTMVYSYDADYTGLGLDLKGTVYQEQVYLVPGDVPGTYALTLSGMSIEDLAALEDYFDLLYFTAE